MSFYPFPSRQLVAASQLPLTLISLEDWAIVTLIGEDCEKYLQGQVTADIPKMTEHEHLLVAHCNPRGKIWSSIRLFHRQNGFAMIGRRNLRDTQITELKKYAIFSKVTITADDEHILMGVAGFKARSALKNLFRMLPDYTTPLVNDGMTSLLWFKYPEERFLLVTDIKTAEHVTEVLIRKAKLNNSQQWLSLNIEAGEPVIDAVNITRFTPCAINLQALGGISFKKGCYIGQEMIVREKFRGVNKRALWYLAGYAGRFPEAGEKLELKIGQYWRRSGTVLAASQLNDGHLLVQAVMNSDIKLDSMIRLCNDVNTLSIKPLPYSIDK